MTVKTDKQLQGQITDHELDVNLQQRNGILLTNNCESNFIKQASG